jgi:hypothetical protein
VLQTRKTVQGSCSTKIEAQGSTGIAAGSSHVRRMEQVQQDTVLGQLHVYEQQLVKMAKTVNALLELPYIMNADTSC